jgi:hypothetical protein
MALLSMEAIRDGIQSDPSIYPHSIDLGRQAVLFLRLDAAALRAASFLDDRILGPQLEGRWVPFGEIERVPPSAPSRRPLHFIFHTGHVGSTLLSRLLDDAPGVLGLREPLPLRTLAAALLDIDAPHALLGASDWKRMLNLHLAYWARGFDGTRNVVVKATSSANSCCSPTLEALQDARAVQLNLRPEPFLATLLAGENSYLDLRGQAQDRMKRLLRLAPDETRPLHALSLGEIAAMGWTSETLTQRAAEQNFADRVLRVDFDEFLAAPGEGLRRICTHLGVVAPDAYFNEVQQSPTLTRYSKAPEHGYTPELRRQILADSRSRNAAEIRRGMQWIEAFAARSPALGAALSS